MQRGAIASHAVAEYPRECCGVIVGATYRPCRNVSDTPNATFALSAEDYARAEDDGPIEAIVHSHPGAAVDPSHADLVACEAAGVPRWIICSVGAQADGSIAVDEWREFGPSGFEAPLIGCEFSHGINDCYGLVRRYYKQLHGIELPDFARSGEWWDDGHSSLYLDNFPAAGFHVVRADSEMVPGDVLLMKIRSGNGVPNHAAVYLGGDEILQHCWGQLSRRDSLSRYLPHVSHRLRHKESDNWNK